MKFLSIIIPTLNEEKLIPRLINHLKRYGNRKAMEILVVDGGSEDGTVAAARNAGARVIVCPQRGRACQMNFGVRAARGDVFWFVHADTLPPSSFYSDLLHARKNGAQIGGYRFRFDSSRLLLRFLSWCTRFDFEFTRGGDQTLFITRALFDRLGGYRKEFLIMEEFDLIRRARSLTKFHILKKNVLVSARKYDHNSFLNVQRANFIAFRMYRRGESPKRIRETYHSMIRHPKDEPV